MNDADFAERFFLARYANTFREYTEVADDLVRKVEKAWPGLIERSFPDIQPVVFIPAFGSGMDPADFGGITGYSTELGLGDGFVDFILVGRGSAMKVTIDPDGLVDCFWLDGSRS